MEKKTKIYNLVILDESGSMGCIYRQALTGVNETLQTIRAAARQYPEQEQYVTLFSFNSLHLNYSLDCVAARSASDLLDAQYQPNGCTPLYDAMGDSLTRLRRQVKDDDKVLVTVITDGMENSSSEYNGRAIKRLVEDLRGKGWAFTYIGSNQDVDAVADSLSINNRLAFREDEAGTREMFKRENAARECFYEACMKDSLRSADDLAEGFFNK